MGNHWQLTDLGNSTEFQLSNVAPGSKATISAMLANLGDSSASHGVSASLCSLCSCCSTYVNICAWMSKAQACLISRFNPSASHYYSIVYDYHNLFQKPFPRTQLPDSLNLDVRPEPQAIKQSSLCLIACSATGFVDCHHPIACGFNACIAGFCHCSLSSLRRFMRGRLISISICSSNYPPAPV